MISPDPRDPALLAPDLRFLAGGGAATQLILARDWSDHPLGEPADWCDTLKSQISTILNSPESMILAWGAETLSFFFNETYIPLLGPRVAWAMGSPFREVWADGWDQAKPIIDDAFAGRSQRFSDLPWKLDTDRGLAETWFSFSYSRILDSTGKIAGLFILTNETTDRVLSDAALLRAQADLLDLNATLEQQVAARTTDRNRLWQLSSDIMLVADFDGTINAVNPAWTHVLGWSEAELLGQPLFGFIHPDDLENTISAAQGIGEGHVFARFGNRYRHKDGSYRDIVWNAGPGDGKIIAVGRDSTEDKAKARALEAAEGQLRQAQKMEAVGQLTGGIAHDFNNLLTGVMGNLELLERRLARGQVDDSERFILAAQQAGRRAAALTQRLLAFSRRQTLDPRATDVNRLIHGMEDLLRRTVGPATTIHVAGAPELWTAMIDPTQFENALLNLCINARDAMPDGGTLTITTENAWFDEATARDRDLAAGPYLAVCVTDTGTGMSAETIDHAFEPFFTTKPIGQGTGLGLSMIYGFARQSGGQVRIISTLGQGSTICVYLPQHAGAAVPQEETASDAPLPVARGGTILLIDDEASIRHLIDEVLDDLGYTVIGAADGAAGIKVLQSGARIDLLITDVGLPNGMNGRQVADLARLLRPELRILFVTGYAETAAFGNGPLDDGMELLTKPFTMHQLTAKVADMLPGTPSASVRSG
ncbi:hybrid sensor histidine kinase/response regulator [Sphingomonas sp. PAMC 26617]|uniref:hybrid sensor histidine kinase/response regulator n=1 Tax=Sphingomonas sp. PAMC 26617 TaxID=1112216 RepID=UPI0002887706|nr:PAS domain-containing sensor histidine kinase [Sphingomonas sp. PAMC 26617]